MDVDIDFGVLLDLERRWFGTIESKRPIFLHANSGNRIVGCNICYSHLLNVRYCSVGFSGVVRWTDWVPLIKEGVFGGLRGRSIDDLGLNGGFCKYFRGLRFGISACEWLCDRIRN